MSEQQSQLAEIDAIVNPSARPEPAKRPGKGAKPVRAAVDDDDDNESAVNDDEEFPPLPTSPAVRSVFAVAGLPSVAEHPAVVAAQANVSRVAEQQKATAAEVAELEKGLGLKPGASARDLDTLAARILATGGTDDTADKFARLETLRVHLNRLGLAADIVNKELSAARDKAAGELSARAREVEYMPAARRVGLALLALMVAKREEALARNRLQAAGFDRGGIGTFSDDVPLLDRTHNLIVLNMIRDGFLTKEEVREALPNLNGL